MAPDDEGERGGDSGTRPVSALELAVSAAGLALLLAMIAFIAWEALTRSGDEPPAVVVRPVEVRPAGDMWVVTFEARNLTPQTAANVEVEGTLSRAGEQVDTGRAMLDYVPGNSTARGGLFFRTDPAGLEMELRASGYAEP